MACLGHVLVREGDPGGEELIERSAQLGYWGAACFLANTATTPAARLGWTTTALDLALAAAAAGDARAASAEASILVGSDRNQAVTLARQAAEAGDPAAMGNLSVLLADERPKRRSVGRTGP